MLAGRSHLPLAPAGGRPFQYVPRPAAAVGSHGHTLERGGLVNTRHPAVIATAVVLGIAFVVLGIVYWAVPAGSLPSWIPGHEAGSGHHHVKHGIASFLVGLALLAFAWFQTGPKSRSAAPPPA